MLQPHPITRTFWRVWPLRFALNTQLSSMSKWPPAPVSRSIGRKPIHMSNVARLILNCCLILTSRHFGDYIAAHTPTKTRCELISSLVRVFCDNNGLKSMPGMTWSTQLPFHSFMSHRIGCTERLTGHIGIGCIDLLPCPVGCSIACLCETGWSSSARKAASLQIPIFGQSDTARLLDCDTIMTKIP